MAAIVMTPIVNRNIHIPGRAGSREVHTCSVSQKVERTVLPYINEDVGLSLLSDPQKRLLRECRECKLCQANISARLATPSLAQA